MPVRRCNHCAHQVDARRCISYLTIELKGPIPVGLRPMIGDRIYGCDDCLDARPWNRFAKVSRETAFAMRREVAAMKLRDYLQSRCREISPAVSRLTSQADETARPVKKCLRRALEMLGQRMICLRSKRRLPMPNR